MGFTIDGYRINLFCTCLNCKKLNYAEQKPAHSCEAYKKRCGIPMGIWNGKNAQCEYYEEKQSSK